jgi:hypothetical protein
MSFRNKLRGAVVGKGYAAGDLTILKINSTRWKASVVSFALFNPKGSLISSQTRWKSDSAHGPAGADCRIVWHD